jgi:hypothetical protein
LGRQTHSGLTKLPSDIIGQKASHRSGVGPEEAMADRVARCYVAAMASFLSTILLPVAVGAVALVLLLGLLNMMRGGSPNRSQKLMRLRVLLQFVAIVITMLTVWAMGR